LLHIFVLDIARDLHHSSTEQITCDHNLEYIKGYKEFEESRLGHRICGIKNYGALNKILTFILQ